MNWIHGTLQGENKKKNYQKAFNVKLWKSTAEKKKIRPMKDNIKICINENGYKWSEFICLRRQDDDWPEKSPWCLGFIKGGKTETSIGNH